MALVNASGEVTFLRVHDRGTGFGPDTDHLDVEVVFKLSDDGGRSIGFQLRDDANRPAREGMLDLLRDAFSNGWKVSTDYDVPKGKKNGVAIRVWLTRPLLRPQRVTREAIVVAPVTGND